MPLKEEKSLALPFAVSSILFFGLLAVSPVKDYLGEWRQFQKEYNRVIGDLPVRIKPVEVGIKQIWIEELGVVDRCTTCHLGISDERLSQLPQPFGSHPPMYHDPEEFGCTPCHGGQGIATTVAESVGNEEFWNDPMLPAEFMEAGCGTCHLEAEVPDASILSRGRKILTDYSCSGCHKIPGIVASFAPPLDGIGSKVNRDWLARWLKHPHEVIGHRRMPAFPLADDELNNLTDFLMNLKSPAGDITLEPLPGVLADEDWDDALVRQGTRRFREARCISCHQVNGRGGPLAADLGTVASKVSPEWLYNYLRNPQKLAPGVPMPRYGFTDEDALAVTAYILNEFVDWELEESSEEAPIAPAPDYYQQGLKVLNAYNCLGCHDLQVPGAFRNMGPDLTGIGEKPLVALEFGHAEIEYSRWSFIYHKLADPGQFLDNSRMPTYNFSPIEAQAVTTALLALRDEVPLRAVKASKGEPAVTLPRGQVGQLVDKYACLACHVIGDEGYLLASSLNREGSRVNADWLQDYFRVPYTLRPTLTERMPNLFMSDDEIDQMAGYIQLVFIDDALDEVEVPLGDEASIKRGRKLLHEVYGCQACHQVAGQGGYVGPPLDLTAQRSKPGWIFAWIKDPQRYRPDTIDPNQGLTDEEALDIAAYIMSLGQESP